MRILVTGGNGLVGSHVVDVAIERGHHVRVLVLPEDPVGRLETLSADIRRGDLRDVNSLESAVKTMDCVIHCAARKGPWGAKEEYEATNIRGLQNLLDVSLTAGVSRFVHTSSITVLGSDIRGAGDENLPLRREPNPYSWSKIEGELLLLRAMTKGAPATIVRPGLIYGPRDTASFGRFATLIQQGRMLLIGNGENHLPLVYARDVASGLMLAGENSRSVGQTYNIVNDEPVTQRDYFRAIAAELEVKPPRWNIPYRFSLAAAALGEAVGHATRSRRPPPLTRFGVQLLGGENRFSIEKAHAELGFVPQTNLKDGVRASVNWFREWQLDGNGSPR